MRLLKAIERHDHAQVKAMLAEDTGLAHQCDASGATVLHYAALHGDREAVQMLLESGAETNSRDSEFRATPTGWAIERSEAHWVARFLNWFPALRQARD